MWWPVLPCGLLIELLTLKPAQAVAVSMVRDYNRQNWRVILWQAGLMVPNPVQANLYSQELRNYDTELNGEIIQPYEIIRLDDLKLYRHHYGWTIWTADQCLYVPYDVLTRHRALRMDRQRAVDLAEQWKQKYQPALFRTRVLVDDTGTEQYPADDAIQGRAGQADISWYIPGQNPGRPDQATGHQAGSETGRAVLMMHSLMA